MEVGDELKKLNVTAVEMETLTEALKDEEFKKMLCDYAHELSDPETKKRYEVEIKQLEQERGFTIEFIHPEPFRALRTSVNGNQKCFINICSNDKVGKPKCKQRESEDGRRGQCWSLPHNLHPGRRDTDPKGNKMMIYDVIFHPETLHIASKNTRFMDMVDSTAMQGIQTAFEVTLDKNNVREMSTKYKGVPQPCVIRKPIPGYKPSEEPDPLAFQYPEPKEPPATKPNGDAEPKSFSVQPHIAKEPTKPNYTVKYRSFMDLQDFRFSRDSAQSPRPKRIVVTIDMPLLKAAADASLEVKERQLLLESEKPAYRLELALAYPVDEDEGEARFDKRRGQLTVTLNVLPSDEAFDYFAVGLDQTDEREEEKSELEEEDKWKEEDEERESKKSKEEVEEEDLRQQTRAEKVEEEIGVEEDEEEEEKFKEPERKGQEVVEEEKLKEQKQGNEKEDGNFNPQKHEDKRDSDADNVPAEEENSSPVLITAEQSSCIGKEGEVNLNLESTPKMTSDHKEETGESVHGNEVETDAAFLHHRSSEESQTPVAANTQCQNNVKDCCFSQECSETPATGEANRSTRGGSGNRVTLLSEEIAREERENEDNLPTEQIFHKPPPVLLREIDRDGNEKIISDHSTSAGFIFQNSLMYELD
ncbi:protein kintoun [Sebastes fasciatus]|uniref:protein kintoun n=1 Tax=Sebastes fasciatus TaxID=394691 RepID=UPI003D9F2B77